MDNEKDTYFVAVKVFFKKDGKLLILKDCFKGGWLKGVQEYLQKTKN